MVIVHVPGESSRIGDFHFISGRNVFDRNRQGRQKLVPGIVSGGAIARILFCSCLDQRGVRDSVDSDPC